MRERRSKACGRVRRISRRGSGGREKSVSSQDYFLALARLDSACAEVVLLPVILALFLQIHVLFYVSLATHNVSFPVLS